MKRIIHPFTVLMLLLLFCLSCSKDDTPFAIQDKNIGELIPVGLDSVQFIRIRLYEGYMYACSAEKGLYRMKQGKPDSWEYLGLRELQGEHAYNISDVAVMSNTIVATLTHQIFRSTDMGATWDSTEFKGCRFVLTQSPHDKNILIAGNDYAQIFMSHDFGKNWAKIFDPYNGKIQINVSEISFHPKNTNEIWASAYGWYPNPFLFRSTDLGCSWETVVDPNNNPEDTYFDHVLSICFDPEQDSVVYAGMKRVWKTSDYGKTWTEFFNAFPDTIEYVLGDYRTIEVNPFNREELWIIESRHGIYHTEDRGKTWEYFKIDDTTQSYGYLEIDWNRRALYLVVWADNIYRMYF